MTKCPSCGADLDNLNLGNTNVGKSSGSRDGGYKGAGNKLKNAIGARPNSATPHRARVSGRKIMD